MKKGIRILIVIILFLLLVAVRGLLEPFFYDPLVFYFKSDYLHKAIPEVNLSLYFLNIFLRYSINAIISVAILNLIFLDKSIFRFVVKFYALSFIILAITLFILLKFNIESNYLLVFYVRRFLIQPLFILILIPAFYFQGLKSRS